MLLRKKLTIGAALVIVVFFGYSLYEFDNGTGPSCDTLTFEQATNVISKDYLEYRMPRWDQDSGKLGTTKPKLEFHRESSQRPDAFFVAFKATGPKGSIEYFATYECKKNNIEYSVK